MKACSHYKKFDLPTEIEPSENPWNAWVLVWDGDRLYYSGFEAGLYWEFLEHLWNSFECIREIARETGEDPSDLRLRIANILGLVQQEWRLRVEEAGW
jgi:hypothetical protein